MRSFQYLIIAYYSIAGVADAADNCPLTNNTAQTDSNNDGLGDVCDANTPAASTRKDCLIYISTKSHKVIENQSDSKYRIKISMKTCNIKRLRLQITLIRLIVINAVVTG